MRTQVERQAAEARQLALDELGTPLIDTTFVVIDLETTGLSPATDRITEIGAVKVRGGDTLGELRTFVHPGRAVPPAITAVTGITDAMLRDAPTIGAVLPTVRRFLGDAVLVGHNLGFDLAFLRAALVQHDHPAYEPVTVDTARLARRLLHDEVRNHRLETLAHHLRARTKPEHRALADARATVDVLHGLIERAGALGATTVEDLRDLARSSSDRSFQRIGLVRDAPRSPGVYRFLDERGEVLYVGKATDLRQRLRSYFGQDRRRRIADLVRETAQVTWSTTATVLEAEVHELRAIHRHRPRYNRRSKRPDAAVYLAITREPFPRLSIVRAPSEHHLRTFGPLPSRSAADQLVAAIHDVVPLRTCTTRLRRRQDHPACILKELGRCGAPCDGTQSSEAYERTVAQAGELLDDPTELVRTLRTRMLRYAKHGRFERAQQVRDRLHAASRALSGVRERASLAAVDELVLARPRPDDSTELAVIRRGRLAGAARVDVPPDASALLATLTALPTEDCPGPPSPRDLEEIGLLLTWTRDERTRIVAASDGWQSPLPGGQALATSLEEARRLSRQVGRDRQLLTGVKVRRRTASPAEQELSGARTSAPRPPADAVARPAHARAT